MSIKQTKDFFYTKLAHHQGEINLGSTGSNPSVGAIVVKNNSVISSGYTSLNGRPHAESNVLKKNLNYKNSDLYVTLEPCSHYGKTPPCTKKIIIKKIKRVIFSINDIDPRSKNLASRVLRKKKINIKKFILKDFAKIFYKSYFLQSSKELPFIDGKLAVSKDFLTISKSSRWITNEHSRRLANFFRSKYDCLLTTSKTVNADNPILNCRIEGLEKKSPDLIILDRFFKIKKNSLLFKKNKGKIYILTNVNNPLKENFFKKLNVKVVKLKNKDGHKNDLKNIFHKIKKMGFNRILVESGLTFLDKLIKHKLIENFYLFKSASILGKSGMNNSNNFYLKKINFSKKNKIKVNLQGDSLYKVKI
jgi:diaminohydroxyphosphoribosylaminopyrimidine deaminase/5-amino-6-(5-phosphoribosylamino)uracil reductase